MGKNVFRVCPWFIALIVSACSSVPFEKVQIEKFPKGEAFIKAPEKEFEKLGHVKSRADFSTLNPEYDEDQLCRLYFNKAVKDLVRLAKTKGADAVIDVKSVVFYADGKFEAMPRPECSDDGSEGQVLVQGVAVKWKKQPFNADLTQKSKSGITKIE